MKLLLKSAFLLAIGLLIAVLATPRSIDSTGYPKKPITLIVAQELPQNVDAEQLFDDAIDAGISIAPGHIFSPCACYTNFIRLSFGHPWSDKTEDAVRWLGRRVTHLAAGAA